MGKLKFVKGDKVIPNRKFKIFTFLNERILTVKDTSLVMLEGYLTFEEVPDKKIGYGILSEYFRKTTLVDRKSKIEKLK